MNRPDALVFDLDGTLWDAAEPTARGWNLALEALGAEVRVTVPGIRSVAGTPFAGCVEILLPELCPASEVTLRCLDEFEKAALVEAGGTLFPGVEEGLRALSAVYQVYLVSNCQDWYLEIFLEKSGLRRCFAGHDCNGCSGLSKAAMLSRLVHRFRLRGAVYIGDTQGDAVAARDAGLDFAFASYGFGSVTAAELAFASFDELAGYYLDGTWSGSG